MSATASFSSVYNLANLTAPASGVTHAAKWLLALLSGQPVTLNMLSQQEFLGPFLGQAMRFDNTANTVPVVVQETTYGWTRTIPAGTTVTFQYEGVQNQNFVFTAQGGNANCVISIYDWPAFPEEGISGNASGIPVTILGTVQVQDALAEGYLANLQPGIVMTSGSVLTTGASQTLFAANAARKYLLIQSAYNSGTSSFVDVWVNMLGGTASVGGADCMRIPAGQPYESQSYVSTSAINAICATASIQLNCWQG